MRNALTFDIEDYYQVAAFRHIIPREEWPQQESRVLRNTERILELLESYQTKATFFILTYDVERFPQLVQMIHEQGHEIACHGFGHQLIYEQGPDAFREDVQRARSLLEERIGSGVRGYRAPTYSITEKSLWALDILIESGFEYDSSIFPIVHDRYGIPSAPRFPYEIQRAAGSIIEFPISTLRLFGRNWPLGGGGYFRLFPVSLFIWGQRRINRKDEMPFIFYLHPWEFDPDQPRIDGLSKFGHYRHYNHLKHTEGRLRALLDRFEFTTVENVLSDLNLLKPVDA